MNENISDFLKRLDNLGTGDRAALKRSAGIMLREADGKALKVFYSCLPYGVSDRMEDRWFAVACLRCLWSADASQGRPLEKIIADLMKSGEFSESTGHRVETILDTAWDSDGYMLTKLARLAALIRQKSDREAVDFGSLLDDLMNWNSDRQYVQRKWARAIFTSVNAD